MPILFAVLALAATGPAVADAGDAVRFATRPTAIHVALSPDGDRIVFIGAYKTGGRAVTVADLKTGDSKIVIAGTGLEFNPVRCDFKTETRLVCTLYGVENFGDANGAYTRVIAVDTDGTKVKMLSQRPRQGTTTVFDGGSIRNWLPDDPRHILMQVDIGYTATVGSLVKAPTAGTGAALVDIDTGTQRLVEPSRARVVDLGADATGAVRFRGTVNADADGYVRDRVTYAVRPKDGKEWMPLTSAALSDARAVEYDGFDGSGDHLYQLAPLDGRTALYTVATDGSGTRTLVYARDDVDVSGVMRIGKYRRPVGATFSTERGEVHYFDRDLATLAGSLAKALPGHPDITIADESWDGTKKLVLADSAGAPGRYYLYDATTRKLGVLVAVYPALDGVALGTVEAVDYTARDGTRIPAFLTLPPGRTDARGLPGLVMPHGGPSARDTARFDWLSQFFAAQGFAVLQPNFRGSAGYGDAFFAKNGFKSWALAVGDVDDGGRWLIAQGVDPKKLAIFGWSYGGYAALQANVVDPGLYRATVAVAPVTDLTLLRASAPRYGNAQVILGEIGDGPHILAGSPARHAAAFGAPVLIFQGDHDLNVDPEQARFMVGQLRGAGKRVEYVEFKNLDHQLDDSTVRTELLTRSAAFLKAAMN